MGSVKAIKGQTLEIDLLEDFRDFGWSISGGVAIHEGCNAGFIQLLNSNYTVGVENKFTYQVSRWSSGSVNIRVGSTNGTSRTADGIYTDILTPQEGDLVQFYSDGNLALDFLAISPLDGDVSTTGRTLAFDEKNKRWVGDFSYKPEMMIRFGNKFFTGKNGALWLHSVNEIRNNFYGEQFPSVITFYCNLNPTEVKTFFTMRQKSNKPWGVEASILPSEGKSSGQRTRIKKGNFKPLNGDWFAKFLRNLDDPRFTTELDALMKGGVMQGSCMEVTITNNDTVEVKLLSVDIEVSPQNYTY